MLRHESSNEHVTGNMAINIMTVQFIQSYESARPVESVDCNVPREIYLCVWYNVGVDTRHLSGVTGTEMVQAAEGAQ